MKITRLKSGYRLRVSDAEYEMLNSLIVDGFMMYEGDENNSVSLDWSPSQKAALTRALRKSDGDMQILRVIDEDHRSGRQL